MVTCSCSLTEETASVAAQGAHCPTDVGALRISWLLLCLLLSLQEELLYSLFVGSSLTGVIIDAAKASRAAFYC